MSGSRQSNFREGDRSEYLAVYFLSALGLVASVPRQEDIGFDLVCSIADNDVGRLTFNSQYLVSVKSLSSPCIDLQPSPSEDGKLSHIRWLFRLELPLLLAVVDKSKEELRLYSTLPAYFVYYSHPDCGALTLIPRITDEDRSDVGRPKMGRAVRSLPGRYHYLVDLGHPVVRGTVRMLSNPNEVRHLKKNLRAAVSWGRIAALQAKLGVPFFFWFAKTQPKGSLADQVGFYVDTMPNAREALDFTYNRIWPTLSSLAMLYKATNERENLEATLRLMRLAPQGVIPQQIWDHVSQT